MAIIGISGKMQSGKDTIASIIQYLTYCNVIKESISYEEYFNRKPGGYNGLYQIKKYAGKLKQIVSILTGIPIEDLEKQEVKDRVLGKEWWQYHVYTNGNKKLVNTSYYNSTHKVKEIIKPTVRQLLQEVGTEAMRDVIHPSCWVNALFVDYKPIYVGGIDPIKGYDNQINIQKYGYPNWIITDVRFPNELQAIKSRGGITIRVNRNDKASTIIEKQEGRLVSINHRSETILDNAEFNYIINNNSDIESLIKKVKGILINEKII